MQRFFCLLIFAFALLVGYEKMRGPAGLQAADHAAVAAADIHDAYVYLLGRLLMLRQQQLDFHYGGARWNEIRHRVAAGALYSTAWLAVDEHSCTVLSVPATGGRRAVQFINGWGDTIAGIGDSAHGEFWVCLAGAPAPVPAGVPRIDLPAKTARLQARFELDADAGRAAALRHRFTARAFGSPRIDPLPALPPWAGGLPGVEAFDAAPALLDSEADPDLRMAPLRAKARAVATAIAADAAQRARVEKLLREPRLPRPFHFPIGSESAVEPALPPPTPEHALAVDGA